MIIVYITDDKGEGMVSVLAKVERIEELKINSNCIGKDCLITFEEEKEQETKEVTK